MPERAASGPGLVSRSFLINNSFNELKIFDNNHLKITKSLNTIKKDKIVQTNRVGITKAVNLKWRWYLRQSRSISKREKGDRNPSMKNKSNNSQ